MADQEELVKSNTSPEETQAGVMEKMKKKTAAAVAKQNKILEHLKIESVPIDFLKPNAYNPNRQSEKDFELLCRSMAEDGFTQPILALTNGVIIDGEHRWMAARHLGYETVPCVLTDMSAEQMRISTLRHNRARGTEDVELTSVLLRDMEKLGALDYAKQELGVSDAEIAFLLKDTSAPDALAGSEFSKAWEPATLEQQVKEIDERTMDGSLMLLKTTGEELSIIKSYSREAAKTMIEFDRRMQGAKTVEERIAVRDEMSVYRVAFSFSGEEANIVTRVLGKKPSERLLELSTVIYKQMIERGEIDPETGRPQKQKKTEESKIAIPKARQVGDGFVTGRAAGASLEDIQMGIVKGPETLNYSARRGQDAPNPKKKRVPRKEKKDV